MANVKLDVEIRIVDPVRAVEIQWHLLQFLTKRFGTVRSVIYELQDIFQPNFTVGCRGGVVYRTRSDVHGSSGRLGVQKKGIESRQLLGRPFIEYIAQCCRQVFVPNLLRWPGSRLV